MRERAPRYTIAGPVVVDASIAVIWFGNEPDRWGAGRLIAADAPLLAPELMATEATNAWWKKLRRREMAAGDLEEAVTTLFAIGIAWTSAVTLLRPAARLAIDLDYPVYDCLYLALALSHSAALATADVDLRRAAGRAGVELWAASR